MKKFICLLVCVISLFAFVACSKDDANAVLDGVKENKEIVIVTSPDYAPFEFVDDTKTGQDQYVGADVELMKYIAKELGVTLKIEVADFNTTLTLLQTGVADLAISGFTYKEERAENYEMSDAYDSEGSQGVIVKAEDAAKYTTLASINALGSNYKVVAQNGSLQADYVNEFLPDIINEPCTLIADGVTLLENDSKVVAMAISSTAAESVINQNKNADGTSKYVFLADTFAVSELDTQLFVFAKKGQTGIIEEINKIIAKVVSEGLYKEWTDEAKELAESLGL